MAYTITAANITYFQSKNCTLNVNGSAVAAGSVIESGDNLVFNANSGFKFSKGSHPMFGYPVLLVEVSSKYAVGSENDTIATLNNLSFSGTNLNFRITTEALPVTGYMLTQSDLDYFLQQSASLKINGLTAAVGDVLTSGDTLVFTAFENYTFISGNDPITGVPTKELYVANGNTRNYANYSDGDTVGTINYTLPDDADTTFTVGTKYTAPPPEPEEYTITQENLDYFANNFATVTVQGQPAEVGTPVLFGDVLVFTAYENYKFLMGEDPITGVPVTGVSIRAQGSNDTDYAIFSQDNTVATVTSSITDGETIIFTIKSDYVPPEPQPAEDGSIYLVDQEDIDKVNASRVLSSGADTIDFTQFMVRLFSIPFEVPQEFIGSQADIYLNYRDTGATAPLITENEFTISLGDIQVTADRGDLSDLKNTVCILHLPYAQPVTLDNNYVIGQTLSIDYVFACNTGLATINVTSTKTGRVISSTITEIATNIPYGAGTDSGAINYDTSTGGDNGVRTAYIEIARTNSDLNDGYFSIPILDDGKLDTRTGYFRVDDIDLNTSATREEKGDILQALQQGVKIQ